MCGGLTVEVPWQPPHQLRSGLHLNACKPRPAHYLTQQPVRSGAATLLGNTLSVGLEFVFCLSLLKSYFKNGFNAW